MRIHTADANRSEIGVFVNRLHVLEGENLVSLFRYKIVTTPFFWLIRETTIQRCTMVESVLSECSMRFALVLEKISKKQLKFGEVKIVESGNC